MDERLVKGARDGDVYTLLNLMVEDPLILERACSVHFADSPLHVAALAGNANFVEQVVSRKPSLATETNQQGMIPLHLASFEGHFETVRELLKAKLLDGVNQCVLKDDKGWTPLHCASKKGQIMVMKELIRECPKCLEQVTGEGETVFHIAVKANEFEAVKVLAESIKLYNLQRVLKAKDQRGKSAYQLAAAKKQFQVMEVLKVLKEEDEEEGTDEQSQSRQNAMLVVATLIITLTYQALVAPPSTLFKGGDTKIDFWSCVISHIKQHGYHGLKNLLKDCPSVLAFYFLLFNTLIFATSIFVVVSTLRGRGMLTVQLLMGYLILCYGILITSLNYNIVYYTVAVAFIAIIAVFLIVPNKELCSNIMKRMASKAWKRLRCSRQISQG